MQPNPDPSWLSKNHIYFCYVGVKINCQRASPACPCTSRCEIQTRCSSSISLQYMSHMRLNVGTSPPPPPPKAKQKLSTDRITAKTEQPPTTSSSMWFIFSFYRCTVLLLQLCLQPALRSRSPPHLSASHPDSRIIVTLMQGSTRQPEDLLLEIEPETERLFLSPTPNSSPL